jgi:beta-lactamase class A
MTLAEIAEAAITLSDNTAGNLLLKANGGPEGLNVFLRSFGDDVTRLDRWEPALNEAKPGDLRDTTTPAAAARTLHEIVLGKALSAGSRETLTGWLLGDRVADALLRASLPKTWKIADKTGAGGNGALGIVAVIWPSDRKPLTVAIYIAETRAPLAERNAVIAELGAELVRAIR